jgi:hypothetical protein
MGILCISVLTSSLLGADHGEYELNTPDRRDPVRASRSTVRIVGRSVIRTDADSGYGGESAGADQLGWPRRA